MVMGWWHTYTILHAAEKKTTPNSIEIRPNISAEYFGETELRPTCSA